MLGVIAAHPELARDGIELRKFGLHIIEILGQERVHTSWIVPGGVGSPLSAQNRDRILADLPAAKAIALRPWRFLRERWTLQRRDRVFRLAPTMYAGLVDDAGNLQFYDGALRFRKADGEIVADQIPTDDYANWIGEASLRESYLKAPYFKPQGFPDGVYRVGPLARLNAAQQCGFPKADAEFKEFHERFGSPRTAHSCITTRG